MAAPHPTLVHMTPMPDNRHPKRQRKKEAAAARRQAMREAAERRRKQRVITLAAITAIVVLGGGALAFMAIRAPEQETIAEATPTPEADPATGDVACGGEVPPAAGEQKPTYEAPEDQELDPDRAYVLRLETSCGTIDIALDHRRAPDTANSIAFLARQGFFDGLTFHRVVPDFVIQGGDPQGDGTGGPGYKVEEAPPENLTYTQGVVAMAKAGNEPPGTSGSQFFIVTADEAPLPAEYALLGEVIEGMAAAEEIEALGTGDGPPSQTVYIEQATIIER